LRRLATAVRGLCLLGAASLLGLSVWFWLGPDWAARAAAQLAPGAQVPTTEAVRWRGMLGFALPVALALYAMRQLWCLFGEYAQGRVFRRTALARLRRLALAGLVLAVALPLTRALLSLLLTFDNPVGQRMLVVSLHWNDYTQLLGALVLLAIAAVMAEAVRVAEDNAGFV
jgi:hypothetical protein